MPALRRNSHDADYNGRRMTADAFFALGETDQRLELVDGVIVMSPRPVPRHQRLLYMLHYQLAAAEAAGRPLRAYPECDLQLGPDLVYAPDIRVYRADRMLKTASKLVLPPDLIIEVLSPGTRAMDLHTKREDYERYGVAEYWVIDPETISAVRWATEGGSYIEVTDTADELASRFIEGLKISLAPLRALLAE